MAIKAIIGRRPGKKTTEVQSVLFSKDWPISRAKKWLGEHGFKSSHVEEGRNYWRFRQAPPDEFSHFATITFRKDNPSLTEQFHGRPPKEVTYADIELFWHPELTVLGDLVEIGLVDGSKLEFDDAILASDDKGKQLYIIGDFDIAGNGRRFNILGKAKNVVYKTDKVHLGENEPVEFIHTFEEKPLIVWDAATNMIVFVGGSYEVKSEGIVK